MCPRCILRVHVDILSFFRIGKKPNVLLAAAMLPEPWLECNVVMEDELELLLEPGD